MASGPADITCFTQDQLVSGVREVARAMDGATASERLKRVRLELANVSAEQSDTKFQQSLRRASDSHEVWVGGCGCVGVWVVWCCVV